MNEMMREMIVDERVRAALDRMKARIARRPGRWRRRMARGLRLDPEPPEAKWLLAHGRVLAVAA